MKSKLSYSPFWLHLALGVPLTIYLFYKGHQVIPHEIVYMRLFLIAFFTWGFIEYIVLNLFVGKVSKIASGRFLFWQLHGDHYNDLHDKDRVMLPLPTLIITGSIVYYLLSLFTPPEYFPTFLAYLMTAYLGMATFHYAYHRTEVKIPMLDWMQRFHHKHHETKRSSRYGISSPLWDLLLNTLESKNER
jgi:sterol desaturase/sphingolipid hydroxylase (fatty acid hydroxylase superfamily)